MSFFDAIFAGAAQPLLASNNGETGAVEYRPPDDLDTSTDPIDATLGNDRWERFNHPRGGIKRVRTVEVIIARDDLAEVRINGRIIVHGTRLDGTSWSIDRISAVSETHYYLECVEHQTIERSRDNYRVGR